MSSGAPISLVCGSFAYHNGARAISLAEGSGFRFDRALVTMIGVRGLHLEECPTINSTRLERLSALPE
ncbi:hypothetical protein [Ensifer aridi]|uniref:hypothetical protein n=1 Tax=Ensifer aridi TaxID=1708715 RepID=UPI000A10D919|nr:hypothetical protein [Ensifer aridi]